MNLRRGLRAVGAIAGLAVFATLLTPVIQPAAASMQSNATVSTTSAVGLIVTYKDGVQDIAANGQPTGENFAGTDLVNSHDIGLNLTAVRFANELSSNDAAAALQRIKRDPRVLSAQLDQHINFSSASLKPAKRIVIKSAVKVASAVQSPKSVNYWSAAASRTPRIKVTWTPPKSLNGGKLVGYRVEMSSNLKTWTSAVTVSTKTATITKGLSIGSVKHFRVRALTKVGSITAVGLPSVAVKATPAVSPLAPKFDGPNVIFSGQSAKWLSQSVAERGGLPMGYQVTAVSPSGDTATCTTIGQSCLPASMAPNVPYTFKVVATNSLASAASVSVSDPMYGSQWHLYSTFGIQAHTAWQVTKGKPTIVVAVLDSGITAHPDLDGQTVQGFDFISSPSNSHDNQALAANTGDWDADPTDVGDYNSSGSNSSWHGTHVAGLIAAAQNTVGVSGVAPGVKILPVRVLGSTGGETSDLIAAINWASGLHVEGVPDNPTPARVMNLSIGTETVSGCDVGTQSAFRSAWDRGVTAVTAAGNGDQYGNAMEAVNSYPGNCYPTINVGASGYSGDSAFYSNYGEGVDFSAPGGDNNDAPAPYTNGTEGMMLSTWNLGTTTVGAPDYSIEEGTSMASPVVAAVVALIYSVNPAFTSEDAYEIIKASVRPFKAGTQCATTAVQYGLPKTDVRYTDGYSYCGAGIVDAGAAVMRAQTTKPTPKP